MSIIDQQRLTEYQEQGFLVLPDFFTAEQCDALRVRAGQLLDDFDVASTRSIFSTHNQDRDEYFLTSGDKIRCFFEEEAFLPDGSLRQSKAESINKIGHALHDLDDTFNKFSRDAKLVTLVEDLGYRKPLLMQSMYIFKQPNIGGEVTCHQDATFLFTEPNTVLGLWIALEDATTENGCLWAIPGGHKRGLKSRYRRKAEGGGTMFDIFDSSPWPLNELVPLAVSKGTLILLDALLPHMSYANRSPRSRHAYTLHIVEADAHYPQDNWLQRDNSLPARGFNP